VGHSRVRRYAIRQVSVVEVAGRLEDVGEDLDRAIQVGLAERARGVVCDLSAVSGVTGPSATDLLASAGRHVRDWPGIPVGVACPDPRLREALRAHPLGHHLIVTPSLLSAMTAVLATRVLTVERLRLAPDQAAPRLAREFLNRTLLRWRLGPIIPSASMVLSELVSNATMDASKDIDLSITWDHGALRLTVRDDGAELPRQPYSHLDSHGRRLSVVALLSRAFGALPTAGGGKVVWAVVDATHGAVHQSAT
jgi:hypothetical protein